jgi:hypothetical protein
MTAGLPVFENAVFTPDATGVMGEAFERACQALGGGQIPSALKEIIATRVLEEASAGERDPDRLYAAAFKSMPHIGRLRSLEHARCGLLPLPHHNAPPLIVAELELHDRCDFSCLRVGCLDVAKVLSAVSENSDAPRPELGGLGLRSRLFQCGGHASR